MCSEYSVTYVPERAGPVIVALTGWAQDADRQRSREAGFNAHIVKPVEASVLANLLVEFPPVGSIR